VGIKKSLKKSLLGLLPQVVSLTSLLDLEVGTTPAMRPAFFPARKGDLNPDYERNNDYERKGDLNLDFFNAVANHAKFYARWDNPDILLFPTLQWPYANSVAGSQYVNGYHLQWNLRWEWTAPIGGQIGKRSCWRSQDWAPE